MRTNVRRLILALAVSSGLAAYAAVAAEPQVVQSLFPYVLVGRVVDYDNVAYDASSGIRLSVSDTKGALLAESEVFTPGGVSAWNFRLDVPVATQSVDGHAAVGDRLSLSAVDKSGNVYTGLLTAENNVVSGAGAYQAVRIMLASDENGNGISDLYEETKEYDMWLADIDGEFDPAADYDHDGMSNLDEYLAGTDPFDPDDYLRAKTLVPRRSADGTADNLLEVTFETNPGRSYAVRETDSLRGDPGPTWRKGLFKLDPASGEKVERVTNPAQKWAMRTIYLLKKGPQRFYRIELEQ